MLTSLTILRLCRKSIISVTIALLLMSHSVPAVARDLEEKKWIKATSPHFQIYSRIGKRKTLDMLRHLEVLRSVQAAAYGFSTIDASIPTLIVAVANSGEFEEVGGDRDFAGHFTARIRRNYVLIRDVRGMDEAKIVMHEYAHFLMKNSDAFTYPTWYSEGYADYLSNTSVNSKSIRMLQYDEGNMLALQRYKWLPVEEILRTPDIGEMDDRERSLFYAQSWALVHFLGSRKPPEPNTSAALRSYVDFREQGIDELESFESAFELNAQSLNRRLKTYLTRELVAKKFPADAFLSEFSPAVVDAEPSDVAIVLGSLAGVFDEIEAAEAFLNRAAEDSSARAEALAGLGRVAVTREQFGGAEKYFDEAVVLGADNGGVLLDAARFYANRAFREQDYEASQEYGRKADESLNAAASLGINSPEYDFLSATRMVQVTGDYESSLILFESAHRKLASNRQIQMALVNVYLQLGRLDEALSIAQIIQAWSFDQPAFFLKMQELIEDLKGQLGAVQKKSNEGQ